MKNYILQMMSGTKIMITEEETNSINLSSKGFLTIQRLNGRINISSIEFILPSSAIQSKMNEGYNSKGEKFIKKFGEWRLARDPSLNLSMQYYPEVAKDQLMSKEEFNSQKLLKDA